MAIIKNIKSNRYLSIIVMIMIIIPALFITACAGKIGVFIGSSMYMFIAMLAIWEVLKSIGFSKILSVIPALAIIPFFLLEYNEFLHVADQNSTIQASVHNSLSFTPYILLLLASFIPILVEPKVIKEKLNWFSIQLIVIFTILISATFAKGTWSMNAQGLNGILTVVFFVLIAVISDSMGYFGGKFFGKKWFNGKKLAPTISPKKTWAGAVLGFICSFIFCLIAGYYMHIWSTISINEWLITIIMSFSLSFISPIGDLAFSLIKRKIGVKDFSNLLPGHGGIFDRIDAISIVICFSTIVFSLTMF